MEKKYSFWKQGFKVFYGPIGQRPELMIISHNPGGDPTNFQQKDKTAFEKGDFALPISSPYSGTYTMTRKMQSLFVDDGFA